MLGTRTKRLGQRDGIHRAAVVRATKPRSPKIRISSLQHQLEDSPASNSKTKGWISEIPQVPAGSEGRALSTPKRFHSQEEVGCSGFRHDRSPPAEWLCVELCLRRVELRTEKKLHGKGGNSMISTGKAVAISTVGYMCFAIAGWMVSMTYASWFARQYGLAILYPLAIVLGVMGILSFIQSRALDAIVFFGGTALLGSVCAYRDSLDITRMTDPHSYLGWFAGLWAAFFAYVLLGSFKSGVTRILFLLGMSLTLLSLAIGGWSGAHGWVILAGYIGLATSLLAGLTSATEVIRFGSAGNPNAPRIETPHAIAAD